MTVASRERRGALALGGVMSTRGLLALVCMAGGLLVVVLRTRLTFFNDDWYFLLQRPGLESHGGSTRCWHRTTGTSLCCWRSCTRLWLGCSALAASCRS